MSAWTTLEMAKKQVGIPLDDCTNDDWLRMTLAAAEAEVLGFVINTGIDVPTFPNKKLSHAMYVYFAHLWRFRGDDTDKDVPQSRIPGSLPIQVERIIWSMRPPSLA